MSQISLKSISGITSITTPAGADNQFTIHTNNTSEVIKLDHAGNIHINNHVNATGISSAASIDVGSNIKLGNAGIITATGISGGTFSGSTATFSGDVSITDKIVHTDDTNTAIRFPAADAVSIETAGSERLRITSAGLVGVGQATPTHMLHVDSSNASDSTATAFFKGRIIRFDGAASAHSPRLNLSLDGTDKATILLHRTNDDLEIQTLTASPIRFSPNSTERLQIGSAGQIGIAGANYGSSGQVLTSQGSGSAVQWATPSSITTAGGTMTLGFQDHVAGAVSSTTPTAYYQRIGNMVFCSCDTGAINLSGLNNGQILLVTGCFPVTRDNNWTMAGSAYQYTVNSGQNSGGPVIVPTMGYWLSNTSLYFVIPRNNSTADNMTVGMCNSNNTRIFMQWHYKVN